MQASEHEQQLTTSISKLNAASFVATNVLVEVSLVGGSPKTYQYSLTAAKGSEAGDMEHKWSVHLVEEAMNRMVCMTGKMELPTRRTSLSHFKYHNRIGFGASCEQYFLNIEASTKTTERQRQWSRNSEASKECSRLSTKVKAVLPSAPHVHILPQVSQLESRLQSSKSEERKSLLEESSRLISKKEESCARKLKLETTMDKVGILILNLDIALHRWRLTSLPLRPFPARSTSLANTWTLLSRPTSWSTSLSCPLSMTGPPDPSRWSWTSCSQPTPST